MAVPRESLETRLAAALAERDAALKDLAVERELTNALRLKSLTPNEADPPRYPETAGPGPAPLRYVIADAANDQLKGVIAPVRELAGWLFKRKS